MEIDTGGGAAGKGFLIELQCSLRSGRLSTHSLEHMTYSAHCENPSTKYSVSVSCSITSTGYHSLDITEA